MDGLVPGRYSLRRASPPDLASALICGDGAARGRQWAASYAKKVIKAAGGRAYLAVREIVFERTSGGFH